MGNNHEVNGDGYFAEQIKKLRENKNLSRSELAMILGISENTLISYEKNKTKPTTALLKAICLYFSVSADTLLNISKDVELVSIKSNGLEWRVKAQEDWNGVNSKDLRDGIDVFKLIVEKGSSTDELRTNPRFSNYGIKKLRELLLIALYSRSVELVDVATSESLQKSLIDKYKPNLRSCLVADIKLPTSPLVDLTIRTEAVALLAAKNTLNSLPNTGIIGLTGGTTIARFVDLVPPGQVNLTGINWVSLLAPKFTSSVVSSSANNVVARMVYNQPGSIGYQFPYISPRKRNLDYYNSSSGDEAMLLREFFALMDMASNATQAYISVGSPEFNYQKTPFYLGMDELQTILNEENTRKKENQNCVGDVLLNLIDRYGNRYGSDITQKRNDELVCSVGLQTLKKIAEEGTVWILANRFGKAKAIHACIQAGYANSLVIDSITANQLLKL